MIRPARPEEFDAVREVFREYGEFVGSPICLENFAREIASLPGEYITLLIAEESGRLAGCAALRTIGEGVAEMKRLYVRPAFQGRGLGRLLTEQITLRARASGYKLLRLDTLPVMENALALYRSLGFREIPPYGGNPAGGDLLRIAALMLLAPYLVAQPRPNVAALVKSALGDGIVPYVAVRPIFADFNGDGHGDVAVVVDFNKHLAAWLRRGVIIHNLESPSLAPLRPDNEQHFCFGLLILDHLLPARKTIFYGCFTGWRLAKSSSAAIDLYMESGETLRLFHDGSQFRTRVVWRN